MRFLRRPTCLLIVIVLVSQFQARVVRVEITARKEVLGGHSFGNDGAYERFTGRGYFSVAVANQHNRGGVRSLELAVPLVTYAGWNPRDSSIDAPDHRVSFEGSYVPFAKSQEAQKIGDSAEHLQDLRRAVNEVIQCKYVSPEDRDVLLKRGQEEWVQGTQQNEKTQQFSSFEGSLLQFRCRATSREIVRVVLFSRDQGRVSC